MCVVSGYQSPVRVVLECSNITLVKSRAQVTVQFKFFLIERDCSIKVQVTVQLTQKY